MVVSITAVGPVGMTAGLAWLFASGASGRLDDGEDADSGEAGGEED